MITSLRTTLVVVGCFASLASSSCERTSDRGPGLRFGKLAPEPGQKIHATSDSDLSISFGSRARANASSSTDESLAYTEEVLSTNGERPQKLRVTFQRAAETIRASGTKVETTRAVAGKTYVVEWHAGSTLVTDAAGHPAAELEADEVKRYLPAVGASDPVIVAVPTSPVRLGDRVDALARAVADEVMRDTSSDGASGATATYRGAAGDKGIFELRVTVSKNIGAWTLSGDLTGELQLSTRTGRPTEIELTGPVTARPRSAPGRPTPKDATGTMRVVLHQSLS
jgi:hypothetical protein